MQRVTGLGGIFFKCHNPKATGEWYRRHLGLDVADWGGAVLHWGAGTAAPSGSTVWSPFPADTDYFAPSTAPFMVNFRVADLDALMAALRSESCTVAEQITDTEQGRFAWVMDPEGHKVELWQPPEGQ